jgi:hypothetical protein
MKNYPLVACFVLFLSVFAQGQDTLALAQDKAYASDLEGADRLLSAYNAHRNDVEALRLHGYILYWKQDYKRSDQVFERALAAFPESANLRLEYGRILWERGKLRPAEAQLLPYLAQDSLHAEANLLQAYIEYWKGDTRKARQRGERISALYPEYGAVKGLLGEIKSATSPWMRLQTQYFTDDQPLAASRTELEVGQYASRWLSPRLQFHYAHFLLEEEARPMLIARGHNQFYLNRSKSRLDVSAGLFAPLTGGGAAQFTGGVFLSQPLPANFSLELGVDRRPYLFTLQSVNEPFSETFAQAALRFDRSGKWMGKAAWERQGFDDGNVVETSYAWMLAPLLNRWGLTLLAGYSFSYADSRENQFQPLIAYDPLRPEEDPVPGVFSPYFTPARQTQHTALGALRYRAGEKLQIGLRGGAGVWAFADIPYFYPDFDPAGNVGYQKGFERMRYSPWELAAELRLKVDRRSSLTATYHRQHLLFYTLNSFGLIYQCHFTP